ncbi:MAG: toxin-antitoxin system protein [Nitrospinae bacterium CG22_combo_CG10-13_8_21_14_all_47_10]|nr:MAG: toxin-antitoxin system protein [Nitrospinae bacterium CG22_combo_CG10-13_8_21_14_all_47_10]
MPTAKDQKKTVRRIASINIRALQQQRDLIDRAAKVTSKKRSEFMLEAACKEANNILLDNQYFLLDQKKFDRFLKALDQPPKDNLLLNRTLNTSPPWGK